MIEFLSKWIEGIAIAVIIASIFEMILPNGNIKKNVKVILGIYIVFSIISPFSESKVKVMLMRTRNKLKERLETEGLL